MTEISYLSDSEAMEGEYRPAAMHNEEDDINILRGPFSPITPVQPGGVGEDTDAITATSKDVPLGESEVDSEAFFHHGGQNAPKHPQNDYQVVRILPFKDMNMNML